VEAASIWLLYCPSHYNAARDPSLLPDRLYVNVPDEDRGWTPIYVAVLVVTLVVLLGLHAFTGYFSA